MQLAPDGTGSANGAAFFIQALNRYQSRRDRVPADRETTPQPYRSEPKIEMPELELMMHGAAQREIDFLLPSQTGRPLVFRGGHGRAPFPIGINNDPYTSRPFMQPMRLLALVALKESGRRARANHPQQALSIQQAVLKLGEALVRHPGSLLDIGLGIEIQHLAVSYMQNGAAKHGPNHQKLLRQFEETLNTLGEAVGEKYAAMDSMARAAEIAEKDPSPVWRIAAVFAAGIRCATDEVTGAELASARRVIETALRDTNPDVRKAALHMRGALLAEERGAGISRRSITR